MNLDILKQIVQQSDHIVFFGGAGTSTESGIPDFRSAEGLFHQEHGVKISPEEILSRDFFLNETEQFYQFYKERMIYPQAAPNLGHRALVKLEQEGRLQAIITQNIDGLHQIAGSKQVLELHGSIHRNRCMQCQTAHTLQDVLNSAEYIPKCKLCEGTIKPDVVLYQEGLDMELLHRAAAHIQQADVLIVAGTSLTVQPAAGLVQYYQGDRLILINKGKTPLDGQANYLVQDSIAHVLSSIIDGVE